MREASPRIGQMVRVTRTIRAPRERVFRAWHDPEDLRRWFGGPEGFVTDSIEIDFRVGGAYRIAIRPPDTEPIYAYGRYLEISPFDRLVFTFSWDGLPVADIGETRVTVEFKETDGATEVVVLHGDFETEDLRVFHGAGWDISLNRMVEQLEKGTRGSHG